MEPKHHCFCGIPVSLTCPVFTFVPRLSSSHPLCSEKSTDRAVSRDPHEQADLSARQRLWHHAASARSLARHEVALGNLRCVLVSDPQLFAGRPESLVYALAAVRMTRDESWAPPVVGSSARLPGDYESLPELRRGLVRRSYSDLQRLFALLPPNYRVGAAESGGGIPTLPAQATTEVLSNPEAAAAHCDQLTRCLDSLRRALQLEAVLQRQGAIRAIDPADYRRLMEGFVSCTCVGGPTTGYSA